jgi:hypothetical protein
MLKVGVLGLLLPFVGHVDEQIETMRFQIAGDNRQELLFMKKQQFLYGFAEHVQQSSLFAANRNARRYLARPFRPHTGLLRPPLLFGGNQKASVRSLTDSVANRGHLYIVNGSNRTDANRAVYF